VIFYSAGVVTQDRRIGSWPLVVESIEKCKEFGFTLHLTPFLVEGSLATFPLKLSFM
jgi:hypothetical protein